MKTFFALVALTLLSSSAFAASRSMTVYGASTAEVEQKVAAAVAGIRAGKLPMQLRAYPECTKKEREFPKSVLNPTIVRVYAIQYNDNTYTVQADGSFRPVFSGTLKVFCGKKLKR
jgi:hypothetical protein